MIVSVRCLQLSQKEEMHPDEVYSIMIARSNPLFYSAIPDGEYSGAELRKMLVTAHPLSSDLKSLYTDNADAPHASLYYMALRLFLSPVSSHNVKDSIFAGGLLNILLLIISYVLLWQIALTLWPGCQWCALAILALAFASPAGGECVLLLREYQMAVCAILWLTLSLLRYTDHAGRSFGNVLQIIPATTAAISTGYLNAYIILSLYLIFFIRDLRHRQGLELFTLPVCGFIALLLGWVIYQGFFNFLLHSNPHTKMAFINLWPTLRQLFVRDLMEGYFTIGGLALTVAGSLLPFIYSPFGRDKARHTAWKLGLLIAVVGLLCVMLIQYTSILKEARYSYPALPLLTLCLPAMLYSWRAKLIPAVTILYAGYYAIMMFIIAPTTTYNWERLQHDLNKDVVMYGLNPNEYPLVIPMLDAGKRYMIVSKSDSVPYSAFDCCIVHYKQSTIDSTYRVKKLVGPLLLLER